MISWVFRVLSWPHPGDRVLTAYKDGECGRSLARAVAVHLRGCQLCRDKAAVHGSVMRALESAANEISEHELSQMVADGRLKLLRSVGTTEIPMSTTGRHDPGQAELIFGCRSPEGSPWAADITLELMYAALLGSRLSGDHGRP